MQYAQNEKATTLMLRIKLDRGWARFAAIYGKNGRVKPGLVIIDGKEVQFLKVAYEIRYYVGGKPKYLPAGRSSSDAEDLRKRFAAQLTARAIANAAGLKVEVEPSRKTIKQARIDYIKSRVDLGPDQLRRYEYVMDLFDKACPNVYVDEITKVHLLTFIKRLADLPVLQALRRKPSTRRHAAQRRKRYPVQLGTLSPRSVFDYFIVLLKFLKDIGVDPKIFPVPPKFEEPVITVYSPEQIKFAFSLLKGSLRIALSLMLKLGLRRQEVAFACFSDINVSKRTFLVRGKPEWGFRVKNWVQREVPIPDDFFDELILWKADHPGQVLIVPNSNGNPDTRLLKSLKRFVYLHGLRCGQCGHCRLGNPDCEEWELHRFRRTYATALVRHVDLRTAQKYLGHKRITSTEHYLLAASAEDGQQAVSAIDFTKPFYGGPNAPKNGAGSSKETSMELTADLSQPEVGLGHPEEPMADSLQKGSEEIE